MNAIGRIVHLAVVRRWSVVLAIVVLAVISAVTARHLKLDALPDITNNQVIILTRAPGLTPEEVERLVTRPVEVAIGGLSGMVQQRSLSRFGISSVTAVFNDEIDPWRARQQVQERIANLAAELPEGVEAPTLGPFTGGLGEVFHIALSSPQRTQAELLELADIRVAPILRGVEGVVEANTWGGRRRSLEVRADPQKMARYGVTLTDLREALRRASGAAAGAFVPTAGGQALLRGLQWPAGPVDLGAAVVPSTSEAAHGRVLRVADLADVVWSDLPRIGAATSDGQGEIVYVMLQMTLHANALDVVERIHERMDKLLQILPKDVRVEVVYDRSELVEATLSTVAKNLIEGALMVLIVLVVMLGSLRAGILVASVIPLSMMGAVAAMVFFDMPGNLMSLGAIDFGLLVDGAVVMVERAVHDLPSLKPMATADERRSKILCALEQVASPMTFSVAVIVLVYVPILALTGVDGKMFRPMALTVVFALLTALVLALTYIPSVTAIMLRPEHIPAREPVAVRVIRRIYEPLLRACVAHPLVVMTVALVALGAGAYAYRQAGTAFVPQLDEGHLVIQTTRAPDISLERAVADGSRLEQVVMNAVPEVQHVTSRIGSPAVATDIMGLEQADVFVHLAPRDQWREGQSKEDLIDAIDAAITNQAPGGDPSFTQPIQMRFNELLGGAVTDVTIEIYGEDLGELYGSAQRIRDALGEVPGAHDARILAPPSVPVIDVRPRVLEAAQVGLDAETVLDVVRSVRLGIPVGHTWDGPVKIPITLCMDRTADQASLSKLEVVTPLGGIVPLSRIADVTLAATPALVNRDDAQRRVVVGFNVRGRSLGEVVEEARVQIGNKVALPQGQHLRYGGQFETLEEARRRMAVVVPLVLVGIVILLLVLFRSVLPAALIFLNVPFAGVGGILALWMRDMPVSISAAIGFIALSGIAVLNGVVLLAGIRHLENAKMDPEAAAVAAARERVRPVSMTALVAALGFVPMAVATGVGAEVQRPLATVVVGGLVTSTTLTLLVLPTLYHGLAKLLRRRRIASTGREGIA